jgi:hypothetical protein
MDDSFVSRREAELQRVAKSAVIHWACQWYSAGKLYQTKSYSPVPPVGAGGAGTEYVGGAGKGAGRLGG